MGIDIFIAGFSAFLVGWVLHVIWWRVSRPSDDLRALTICLLLISSTISLGFYAMDLLDGIGLFLTLILCLSLGIAYIFWYPAAQAASPTMLITIIAAESGRKGFGKETMRQRLSEDLLSGNSLDSLLDEQFAEEDDAGHLQLASRGRRTLAMIRLLRHAAGFADPKG
jgi:hypothetical protein